MDGLWPTGRSQEQFRQAAIVRHRLLSFNLSQTGLINDSDASSYGSVDPNGIASGTFTDRGMEGGPHFILSPETPDGRPTLGFEWCLLDFDNAAQPDEGGFTVTLWVLIASTETASGQTNPRWAAFEPITGVQYRELYHSFDTNATALRFQIENYVEPEPPPSQQLSTVMVAFAEL